MDTQFYKFLYNDLSLLNDNQLHEHYNIHGNNENRICSEQDFYNKYYNFNLEIYKESNKDLKDMNNLELIKHYIFHGVYENRICSNLNIKNTMNLSKLSGDKELFSGTQLKENTMNLSKRSGDKELFSGTQVKENTKIAIIFYGLTRSLNKTINSIRKNIFNVLDRHNIQYDIYIHTYKINGSYKNIWSGEETNNYQNEDIISLLHPKYYLFDEQSNVENSIDFNEYYTFLNWNGFFPQDMVKYIIKNLVLALYSKNKITQLFNQNKSQYDYAIISRPDLEITNELDINYFHQLNNNNIIIPEQDSYEGCNDRFCIGTPSIISYYGTLYNKLLQYSKQKNIISECYLLDMLNDENINIIKKNISYNTVRIK